MFLYFRDLYICGGDFYDDKLLELVEIIGGQLSSLYLQFVDTIDIKVIPKGLEAMLVQLGFISQTKYVCMYVFMLYLLIYRQKKCYHWT